MNGLVFLLLIIALSGCASLPPDKDHKVSTALQQRTAHSLTKAKPGEVVMPLAVSLADGLSEDEAVTLALVNNAAFLETLSDLGVARADVIQAGLLTNPTWSMLFPTGPKQLEFSAKFPAEALWLRPRRVAAAKLDYERTAERLVQNGLDLIRDVKIAFIDLTLANRRVKLAEESASLAGQIEQLARKRVSAGDASELEISTATVDTLQANELLARSRHDARLAQDRLRYLIGLGPENWSTGIVELPPMPSLEPDASLLVPNALAARPDLRAAELGIEAAGKRAGLARFEVYALTGILDANGAGSSFEMGPGLEIPIPIFHQNQGGIALAKARLEKAARQYVTVRNRIMLEVREAHGRLRQAQESVAAWRERILPPLEQSLGQAEKAYRGGDVSFLFVLETTRKLADARTKEAAATADLHRAWAELERSVGYRLDAQRSFAQP